MVTLVPVYYPPLLMFSLFLGAIIRFLIMLPPEVNLNSHLIIDIPQTLSPAFLSRGPHMDVVSLVFLVPAHIGVSAAVLETKMKVHFCLQSGKPIWGSYTC